MNNAQVLEKLRAYRLLHGTKLDAPWKKNPNIILGQYVDKLIEGLEKKDPRERCGMPTLRTVNRIVGKSPSLAKVINISLTSMESQSIQSGDTVQQMAGGTVVRIRRKEDLDRDLRELSDVKDSIGDYYWMPTTADLLELLNKPEFEKANKVHDWRNHVSDAAMEIWDEIGVKARLVIYEMAAERASNEEWE